MNVCTKQKRKTKINNRLLQISKRIGQIQNVLRVACAEQADSG